MTGLLERQALFTLNEEGFPCSTYPCVISCTCKEYIKQDKTWEQQDKSMIYTNDKGN